MTSRRALPTLALALVLVAAVAPAPAAPGERVLVVGDSLSVGMEPYLARALGGYDIRTDAEIGRGSQAAVDALAENLTPDDDVIVFPLGSNDDPSQPQALADSLEDANELAAGRCLVVATLEVSGYSGAPEEPLNEVIRSFAAVTPNVRLVDWHAIAEPELLSDGGHATAEGYELRAALFADAIESCDAAPAAEGGSDGIPNPDREALAERRDRHDPGRERREPERVGRGVAIEILADALSSQIAIGAL